MIVKEKDAWEHDCPRKLSLDAFNQSCNGQKCMAWRWAVEENPDYVHPNVMAIPDPRTNPMFIRSKTHGYCGLAGSA